MYTHSDSFVGINDVFVVQFAVCDEEEDEYNDEAPSPAPQSMQSVQVKEHIVTYLININLGSFLVFWPRSCGLLFKR